MPPKQDKQLKTDSLHSTSGFPHFSRFISARRVQALKFSLRFLVFLGIFVIFIINVGAGLRPDRRLENTRGSGDLSLRKKLITDPKNSENYRFLAGEFLNNHDLKSAAYFNDLGLSFFSSSLPLLQQKDEIYYLANEPRFLMKEIPQWKKVVNYYPDYRDGYARLMWLNLKLGRREEAEKYVEAVKNINPNWPPLEYINL